MARVVNVTQEDILKIPKAEKQMDAYYWVVLEAAEKEIGREITVDFTYDRNTYMCELDFTYDRNTYMCELVFTNSPDEENVWDGTRIGKSSFYVENEMKPFSFTIIGLPARIKTHG